MNRHITLALLALNIFSCLAAPQNNAAVEKTESDTASVVAERVKGDVSLLSTYQNDAAMIRACVNYECKWMSVGAARALDRNKIKGVFAESRNTEMTKALTPSVNTVRESMKGVEEQKARLEKLQKEMAAMNSLFSKGAQSAAQQQSQLAAMMTKGVSLPAAPPSKGLAAAMPPSKGASMFAAPPSKGGSAAATMQLEAAMCPMTMFELGKTQKLYAETNAQLQNANSMNAMLLGQKRNLENQKAIAEMGKLKAEQQAAFNAKYAAEQKQRGDLLALELAKVKAEKAALENQKAQLESALASTQQSLANEKRTNAALTVALSTCNQEKAQLQQEKAALINQLKETRDNLKKTEAELESEQNAHARTQRQLAATQQELELTEKARKQLEEAKQQLEDELQETKGQLEKVTGERNQLQTTLDATSTLLAKCREDKMQCDSALAQEKAVTAQLRKQLADAVTLIAAEKKAREELTKLLMSVKDTAEKLQQEVQKLQLENLQLKQQLMKLKSEQEAALAMAAGCPPTYEKFGLSCYKYVREKTQWKMAQEQCMKDGGNLVSVESRQEQIFLVDYLKRHGASAETYAFTGGIKSMGHWKWLGSNHRYIGEAGPQYWFNELTKMKPNYDCGAMYLRDPSQFGKWVGLPCYNSASYTCEYDISPPGTPVPANNAEAKAMYKMTQQAPAYLANAAMSKGSFAFAPPSKGAFAYAPRVNTKGRF